MSKYSKEDLERGNKDELVEVPVKNEVSHKNNSELSSLDDKRVVKDMVDSYKEVDEFLERNMVDDRLDVPEVFVKNEDGEYEFDQDAYDVIFDDLPLEYNLIKEYYGFDSFPYGIKKKIVTFVGLYFGIMFIIGFGMVFNFFTLKTFWVMAIFFSPFLIIAFFNYLNARWLEFYEISGVVTSVDYKLSALSMNGRGGKVARRGLLLFGVGETVMHKRVTMTTGNRFISFDIPDTAANSNVVVGSPITLFVQKGTPVKEGGQGIHFPIIMDYQLGVISNDDAKVVRKEAKVDDVVKLEKKDLKAIELEKEKEKISQAIANGDLTKLTNTQLEILNKSIEGFEDLKSIENKED